MSILKKFQEAKGNYKVTFTFPANEGVNEVQVLGDFNNWDSNQAPKFKKGKDGFSTSVEISAGNSYEFRYLINGNQWENDPNADQLVPSFYMGTQNSLLVLETVAPNALKSTTVKEAPKKITPKKEKTETVASIKTVKVVAAKPTKNAATKSKAAK